MICEPCKQEFIEILKHALPLLRIEPFTLYAGSRYETGVIVTYKDDTPYRQELPKRLDLVPHSETFSWGALGSGPAQLSLALCAHALGNDNAALEVYQDFMADEVQFLPEQQWELTGDEVRVKIKRLLEARG